MRLALPPRPNLGLSSNLLEGKPCTPDERALDAEYQRQLDVWISEIDALYAIHFPQDTASVQHPARAGATGPVFSDASFTLAPARRGHGPSPKS